MQGAESAARADEVRAGEARAGERSSPAAGATTAAPFVPARNRLRGDGAVNEYGHMYERLVSVNQRVNSGQLIAHVGRVRGEPRLNAAVVRTSGRA